MSVTIVLPISRTDYLKPVFDCLDKLDRPKDTELIIITDGDEKLQQAVDRRLDMIEYSHIQVINHSNEAERDLNNRRFRIAAIHNQAKHYVSDKSKYVFCIEDDTTYPANALEKMMTDGDCGYVEGVELGRRNSPYVGAWKADDVMDPQVITSMMPGEYVYEPIDAGGLYCCLIRAELYKQHVFEPFDKEGTNGLACDVNLGLYIRQMGYECFIDWTIVCDHIGDKGSVNIGNTKPEQLQFVKGKDGWKVNRI